MKVLLIEDSPGDARLIRELLKEGRVDNTVIIAGRLDTGMENLSTQDIDVLLLDMDLPDSHGIETLTKVQTQFPFLPIVIMTGFDSEELASQSVYHGAQDYLVKGQVDSRLLDRALRHAVERKQFGEALRKSHDDLELRTAELQDANKRLNDSRRAALNIMEDAVIARDQARDLSAKLIIEIKERTKAEEQIRQAARQWQTTFDSIPDLVSIQDRDFRLVNANEAYKKASGMSLEQLRGKRCFNVIHQTDCPVKNCPHTRTLQTKNTETEIVYEPRLEIYLEVTTSPLLDESGELIGTVHVAKNVTNRKHAEEALAARNAELQAANKELEAFTYSISHDLRGPVRHMAGFSGILLEEYSDRLDAEGLHYLRQISAGAEKLNHLIEDMLRLSQIGRHNLYLTPVDLTSVAQGVVHALREGEPGRLVTVCIAKQITAMADQRLMEMALSNLLGNAWKFTGKTANARIEFDVVSHARPPVEGPSPATTIYFIRDNGVGFDPGYAEKMFRPFERLHADSEFPGTGIGLAIVERIIRRHGGTIWAEGKIGEGATIYFTLPKAKGDLRRE